ncbi:AraC family transcriptional regulator [Microvirga sp. TS319]|uniref:AraC family transcriptional regulator n=1 Tax=Microvirga sp. TS319 TaxID=3241165 RepID=UPI00351AA0F2
MSSDRPEPAPRPGFAVASPRPALPYGYIHLGVAKGVAPALRDFGLDPDATIREAGLDPRLFDDGENVIPNATLGRLLSLCVLQTNCPHFGLLVGRRATILSLGMLGRLMQHSETLGDALRAIVTYLGVQNRGAVPLLAVSNDLALFSFMIYQPHIESADQISDGALAVTVNAIRTLIGSDWNPTEVLLPRIVPPDPEPYLRHFRAPVRFDQESATIVLPARDLARRIHGADPLMRILLEERIEHMTDSASDFADGIRRLLRTRLTSNRCSAEDIAALMAMHRRTLSRRLKDSGAGYRIIANEIRFEIARQLLEDTEVSLCQIAAALGYSEASAFTRAFRRWSGRTPTAWRAKGRQR